MRNGDPTSRMKIMTDAPKPAKYPLLETLLAYRALPFQALFTIRDAAMLFGVSIRCIQDRVKRKILNSRDLPGRVKFLPIDLEEFLKNSSRQP